MRQKIFTKLNSVQTLNYCLPACNNKNNNKFIAENTIVILIMMILVICIKWFIQIIDFHLI